ncbi:MAG TPA: GNAT family N-acetyltransferase [Rhodospirillales bacterium]
MKATAAVIREAEGASDMAGVRRLFLDYQDWLQVDLSFQGFAEEVRSLPGRYARPFGRLLLAVDGDEIAGGVGMWALEPPEVCEMKRLFVYDRWQGRGLGRRLAEAIMTEATAAGYARMRLDTLGFMAAARSLYRALGFVECAPYYDNPLADVLYLEKRLAG